MPESINLMERTTKDFIHLKNKRTSSRGSVTHAPSPKTGPYQSSVHGFCTLSQWFFLEMKKLKKVLFTAVFLFAQICCWYFWHRYIYLSDDNFLGTFFKSSHYPICILLIAIFLYSRRNRSTFVGYHQATIVMAILIFIFSACLQAHIW